MTVDRTAGFQGPGQGPVICRGNHQQSSLMCESQIPRLGESGTNHPELGVNLSFKFVNGLLRFKNPERIVAGAP
jgi:hypothetical protein